MHTGSTLLTFSKYTRERCKCKNIMIAKSFSNHPPSVHGVIALCQVPVSTEVSSRFWELGRVWGQLSSSTHMFLWKPAHIHFRCQVELALSPPPEWTCASFLANRNAALVIGSRMCMWSKAPIRANLGMFTYTTQKETLHFLLYSSEEDRHRLETL